MAAIRTTRHERDDLTIHAVTGKVTLDEIFRCVRAYNQAAPTANTLWDFRNGSVPTRSSDAMSSRARESAQLIPRSRVGKVALVAEGNLEFGVLTVWSTFTEAVSDNLKLRLFHSYDNAIAWFEE